MQHAGHRAHPASDPPRRSSLHRVSFNGMTTYHAPFDDDVAHVRQAGFGGLGVWRQKLTDFGEERGVDLLREARLRVSCLACAGGFTGADGQSFAEALRDALDALRLAADLAADCLVVVTGPQAGHTRNHARRLALDALRRVGDAAGVAGVDIAVQALPRRLMNCATFLRTLDAAFDLVDECDHPRVGLALESSRLRNSSLPAAAARDLCRFVKLAVLSEDATDPPTDGGTPATGASGSAADLVDALERGGYRGWYDVQWLSPRCWSSDPASLVGECRRLLEADFQELPERPVAAPAACHRALETVQPQPA